MAAPAPWTLLDGPAADHLMHDTRTLIIRYVRANPGAMPKAIAEATGINANTVRKPAPAWWAYARELRQLGGIDRVSRIGSEGRRTGHLRLIDTEDR